MHPDYDKKMYRVDSDDLDTTLDTILDASIDTIEVGSIDISSAYPSLMTSKDDKYSLGELRAYTSLNEDVLLEAFRSIAFEEPNDLAKTLIEYYYESKHHPEGERFTLLKKKLESEYHLNV